MVDRRQRVRKINLWKKLILAGLESKLEHDLDEAVEMIVHGLIGFILGRWAFLLKNKKDTNSWTRFYNEHHKEAIGAIIAIVELLEAVGEGKSVPDKYVQMLKEMSVDI
jgi:hypothetical protein